MPRRKYKINKERVQCKNCKQWPLYLRRHFIKCKDCEATYTENEINQLKKETRQRKIESNKCNRKYDSVQRKHKYQEKKFQKSFDMITINIPNTNEVVKYKPGKQNPIHDQLNPLIHS